MRRYTVILGLICLLAVLAAIAVMRNEDTSKMRQANAQDILKILSENPEGIIRQLGLVNLDLSLPGDGQGARVLVRVEPGKSDQVPRSVLVEHEGRTLEVPLEASETYEAYSAQ